MREMEHKLCVKRENNLCVCRSEAKRELERALEIAPGDPSATAALGVALKAAGMTGQVKTQRFTDVPGTNFWTRRY